MRLHMPLQSKASALSALSSAAERTPKHEVCDLD